MAVVSMEESAFLITVHRVVGRIRIQHHLRWRLLLALQKRCPMSVDRRQTRHH